MVAKLHFFWCFYIRIYGKIVYIRIYTNIYGVYGPEVRIYASLSYTPSVTPFPSFLKISFLSSSNCDSYGAWAEQTNTPQDPQRSVPENVKRRNICTHFSVVRSLIRSTCVFSTCVVALCGALWLIRFNAPAENCCTTRCTIAPLRCRSHKVAASLI